MKKKITQVPVPGGSGLIPTGAMQFENDWPGLFVRGDEAVRLEVHIRALQERLAKHPDPLVGMLLVQLNQIADIIEKDVKIQ